MVQSQKPHLSWRPCLLLFHFQRFQLWGPLSAQTPTDRFVKMETSLSRDLRWKLLLLCITVTVFCFLNILSFLFRFNRHWRQELPVLLGHHLPLLHQVNIICWNVVWTKALVSISLCCVWLHSTFLTSLLKWHPLIILNYILSCQPTFTLIWMFSSLAWLHGSNAICNRTQKPQHKLSRVVCDRFHADSS